jgi:hypothetical protein
LISYNSQKSRHSFPMGFIVQISKADQYLYYRSDKSSSKS